MEPHPWPPRRSGASSHAASQPPPDRARWSTHPLAADPDLSQPAWPAPGRRRYGPKPKWPDGFSENPGTQALRVKSRCGILSVQLAAPALGRGQLPRTGVINVAAVSSSARERLLFTLELSLTCSPPPEWWSARPLHWTDLKVSETTCRPSACSNATEFGSNTAQSGANE